MAYLEVALVANDDDAKVVVGVLHGVLRVLHSLEVLLQLRQGFRVGDRVDEEEALPFATSALLQGLRNATVDVVRVSVSVRE